MAIVVLPEPVPPAIPNTSGFDTAALLSQKAGPSSHEQATHRTQKIRGHRRQHGLGEVLARRVSFARIRPDAVLRAERYESLPLRFLSRHEDLVVPLAALLPDEEVPHSSGAVELGPTCTSGQDDLRGRGDLRGEPVP